MQTTPYSVAVPIWDQVEDKKGLIPFTENFVRERLGITDFIVISAQNTHLLNAIYTDQLDQRVLNTQQIAETVFAAFNSNPLSPVGQWLREGNNFNTFLNRLRNPSSRPIPGQKTNRATQREVLKLLSKDTKDGNEGQETDNNATKPNTLVLISSDIISSTDSFIATGRVSLATVLKQIDTIKDPEQNFRLRYYLIERIDNTKLRSARCSIPDTRRDCLPISTFDQVAKVVSLLSSDNCDLDEVIKLLPDTETEPNPKAALAMVLVNAIFIGTSNPNNFYSNWCKLIPKFLGQPVKATKPTNHSFDLANRLKSLDSTAAQRDEYQEIKKQLIDDLLLLYKIEESVEAESSETINTTLAATIVEELTKANYDPQTILQDIPATINHDELLHKLISTAVLEFNESPLGICLRSSEGAANFLSNLQKLSQAIKNPNDSTNGKDSKANRGQKLVTEGDYSLIKTQCGIRKQELGRNLRPSEFATIVQGILNQTGRKICAATAILCAPQVGEQLEKNRVGRRKKAEPTNGHATNSESSIQETGTTIIENSRTIKLVERLDEITKTDRSIRTNKEQQLTKDLLNSCGINSTRRISPASNIESQRILQRICSNECDLAELKTQEIPPDSDPDRVISALVNNAIYSGESSSIGRAIRDNEAGFSRNLQALAQMLKATSES